MKASLRLPFALTAILAMLLIGSPASADNTHSTIDLACDSTPTTAGAVATSTCTFDFSDFGNTSNDKTDWFKIELPVDAKINEDGTHDGADPSDGEKVGETTVRTELSYNFCDDNNNDGGTYSTYWEDTWTTYTAPNGWTKVAEFDTVFTVAFFFTEHVPSHVIKHNTTGQYAVDTNLPQDRACNGAQTTFNPLTTYGYAQNNSAQEWVGKNPSTVGTFTVTIIATEVGGTTHKDTDTITTT